MTTVVHLYSVEAGEASLAGRYVRIDRQTPWGNPFVIGRDGSRARVMKLFRTWFYDDARADFRAAAAQALTDRVLGCWCKGSHHPTQACHGDVYVEWCDSCKERHDEPR